MIKMAAVDDDEMILAQVRDCIEGINDLPEEVEISVFSSAEEFLAQIKPEDVYHVLFSDIQMEGMDGIELGRQIQERFPHIYLIYLTSFRHYAVDSYMVDAYQYILKSQMGERIPPVLNKLILEIQRERKKFRIIEADDERQKIFYQDIIYIKKAKGAKYVEYVTLWGNCRERISMEQLLQEMNSKEFIQVERGCVVNLEHIVRVRKNVIYVQNGDEIVVSRTRLPEVRKMINEQWGMI